MPLPEDEERQLQEIEQALCRDDPKFRRRVRATDPQVRYKRKLIQAQLGIGRASCRERVSKQV